MKVNSNLVVIGLLSVISLFTTIPVNAELFPAPINNDNQTQIQQQIHGLQQHLTDIQKIQAEKATQETAIRMAPILKYDTEKNCSTNQSYGNMTFKTYLTHFACGHVTVFNNGTTLRQFTLITNDYGGTGTPIKISTNKTDPVIFHAWTFNGTVPGPTMRMTQGDHIQIRVVNSQESHMAHSFHMHSIHPGTADGMIGPGGSIAPASEFTYDFIAMPAGVYPYHCHMAPVEEHISRGLYGVMIIDPITPRPPAAEMVMLLNGYTFSDQGINGSGTFPPTVPATAQQLRNNLTDAEEAADEGNGPDNQFYSVNGMPFGYIGKDSIPLTTGVPYRIYLVNMVEFDPVNSFHMHGNMFNFWESGTLQSSPVYTDILTLGQGDRGILEFHYNLPGMFMFHSHINHFTDLGWVGFFDVRTPDGKGQPSG